MRFHSRGIPLANRLLKKWLLTTNPRKNFIAIAGDLEFNF
jgi:hypothetical protein